MNIFSSVINIYSSLYIYGHDLASEPEIEPVEVGCKTTTVGNEYDGGLAKTTSGKTCQRWDSQSPHG